MSYELSKSITKLFRPGIYGILDKSQAEGLIVTLRGNKIVKCSKRQKAIGVYTAGSFRKVMLFSGERIEVTIPEGIIYYGNAQVKVGKEK